jgi:hypothetical protein
MDAAAGGSGDGGGNQSSHAKGKTQVAPHVKPKKKGAWERAMLRYLQRCHEDDVAAGLKPPFGGRFAPPAAPSEIAPTPSTNNINQPSELAKKPSSSTSKDA